MRARYCYMSQRKRRRALCSRKFKSYFTTIRPFPFFVHIIIIYILLSLPSPFCFFAVNLQYRSTSRAVVEESSPLAPSYDRSPPQDDRDFIHLDNYLRVAAAVIRNNACTANEKLNVIKKEKCGQWERVERVCNVRILFVCDNGKKLNGLFAENVISVGLRVHVIVKCTVDRMATGIKSRKQFFLSLETRN